MIQVLTGDNEWKWDDKNDNELKPSGIYTKNELEKHEKYMVREAVEFMMDKNHHLFVQYFDSLFARSEQFAEKYHDYRRLPNSQGLSNREYI